MTKHFYGSSHLKFGSELSSFCIGTLPVSVWQMVVWEKSAQDLTNKSMMFSQTHRAVVNYTLSLLENTVLENECHMIEVLSNVLKIQKEASCSKSLQSSHNYTRHAKFVHIHNNMIFHLNHIPHGNLLLILTGNHVIFLTLLTQLMVLIPVWLLKILGTGKGLQSVLITMNT